MTGHTSGQHTAGQGQRSPAVVAELATRGFIGRPWPTILAATGIGLPAMWISFSFDPPVLVSMAALFAGILGIFRLLIVIIPGVIYMGWRVSTARADARRNGGTRNREAAR